MTFQPYFYCPGWGWNKPLDNPSEEGYTNNMTTTETENTATLTEQAIVGMVAAAINSGSILIESFTGGPKPYRLTLNGRKVVACTCDDYLYRARECKHQRAFASLIRTHG